MNCPNCKNKEVDLFWDRVVFCPKCKSTSLLGDDRYVLSCIIDRSSLVPRKNYLTPTLVCLECGKEYKVPDGSTPQILQEGLD